MPIRRPITLPGLSCLAQLSGAALLAAVALSACELPDHDDPPSIGVLIDHSGSIARPAWRDAALLALEHTNAALERVAAWNGIHFHLRFADSANTPPVAVQRAQGLVRAGVRALVADTSDVAVALNQTNYDQDPNNNLAVPIICMGCTSPQLNNSFVGDPDAARQAALRDPDRWLWRTAAHSGPEAVALLRAARALGVQGDTNGDGRWKVAVYVSDNEFGSSTFKALQEARDRNFPLNRDPNTMTEQPGGLHLEVVKHPPGVEANDYDWGGDLTRLVDGQNHSPSVNPGLVAVGELPPEVEQDGFPDAIIEVTFPLFAASITRAYAEARVNIPFIHGDNWRRETTLIKLLPLDIEGHQGVSHAIIDNCETAGAAFADGMVQRTGRAPGLWDAQTYDAAVVAMLASLIALQHSDKETLAAITGLEVREGLDILRQISGSQKAPAGTEGLARAAEAIARGQTIDYEGASGPVDFDPQGNVINNFVQYRVKARRFVDEITYACVTDPVACGVTQQPCSR
jgi:ABC-type branched-subunit amino acid transport system substrate-binding protein